MCLEDCLEKWKIELVDIFNAAVRAVQPASIVDNFVSIVGNEMRIYDTTRKLDENVYVIGFGKGVLGMAAVMEKKLGKRLRRGIVSIPRGAKDSYYRFVDKSTNEIYYPNFRGPIDYRENSTNNQPDDDTLVISHDIVDLAESLGENDTLIVLVSGGGSALFFMPRPTIEPESKMRFCKRLQDSGASIQELNTIRKKLSMTKGGGLALMAYPAKVVTLILSDIVGDPIDLVASGPTIYSDKSPDLVMSILRKYNLDDKVDGDLKNLLALTETKIDEKKLLSATKEFKHVDNIVIGNNKLATEAACLEARKKGFHTSILRNDVVGNVIDVSYSYAKLASLVCRAWSKLIDKNYFYDSMKNDECLSLPESKIHEIFNTLMISNTSKIILIAGGEPEVAVKGNGCGGRNQELALSFSINFLDCVNNYPQLANYEVIFLSAGTDGQDGPTDAAGAFGYPAIEPMVNVLLQKLQKILKENELSKKNSNNWNSKNLEILSKLRVAETIVPLNAIRNNDSYNFYSRFRKGKDLLKTEITGTNVMDLHFLLIKKRDCDCSLNFTNDQHFVDPLEEHDLDEDNDEESSQLKMGQKINDRKSKFIDLKILDSSLTENCCKKMSD